MRPLPETAPATIALWQTRLTAGSMLALSLLLGLFMLAAAAGPRMYAYAMPVTGILMAGAALAAGRRAEFPLRTGLWVIALAALAMLSALWAPDAGKAAKDALRLALVLLPSLLLIAPVARLGETGARLVVYGYLAGTALLAMELWTGMPLYCFLKNIPMNDPHLRPDFLNRHVVCLMLLAAPVLVLNRHLGLTPRVRAVLAGATAAFLILILLKTGSQSSKLALATIVAFAAVFPYRWKAAWAALAALLAAGILGAPWLATWMHHALPPLLPYIPLIGEPTAYAPQRLEIWNHVSFHIFDHPLRGHGIEATRTFNDFSSDQPSQRTTRIMHPHNAALQLWMEFGVIGAIIGTGLLLQILRALFRQPRAAQRVALPVFMGSLSMGAMSYGLWQGWWLGLLLLTAALTTLAARRAAEAASNAPSPS